MSENTQIKDELNSTPPPDRLPTRVWKTEQRPTSIPNDSERKEIPERREKSDQPDARSRQIERLLGCAYRTSVCRNAEGVPFALIPGETIDQFDVVLLHSREFATFFREEYYAQHGQFPQEAILRLVRDILDRRVSRRAGASPPVAIRVAGGQAEHAHEPGQPQAFREVLALDLGRRSPAAPDSVLEIDADGWSVNHSSGFAFVRPRGYRTLPLPEPAGPEALTELKDLLRVDDHDWLRILIWLLAAMRPTGPYPMLLLQGETGSGKSQAARMLRALLDPSGVPFQPLSTNPNSQANQTWIQVFDHVTAMPKEVSSALCRLSGSAGYNIVRGSSPMTVSLARPILMTVPTGASGAAWTPRGDLLDRMLTVTLPPLTPETTRPESEIAERFAKARPKILGALAQAVSVAMSRVDQIHLESYPRNAEAAVWAIAASPALNTSPQSLQQALEQKSQFQIPKDPLLQKLATFMATQDHWQGTATQLKLELDLSDAPNHLSRKLKEVQETLQVEGIEVAFPPRQENGQLIRITNVHKTKLQRTCPSAADRPVGSVDSTSIATAVTVLPKIDRQIVSAQQNKREMITVPPQPDRQAVLPGHQDRTARRIDCGDRRYGSGTRGANHPSPIVSRCTNRWCDVD